MKKRFFLYPLVIFLFLFTCPVVFGQLLCPDKIMSKDEKYKVENNAYEQIEYLISALKVLVDPSVNVEVKNGTRQWIMEEFFLDQRLNPKNPNWVIYELQLNPDYLEKSSKSFEGYLNYLMSRSDYGQTVTLDWCMPTNEDHPIEYKKQNFVNDVVGQDTCLYVPYTANLPIGEQLLVKYNQIPHYKYICRDFELGVRVRFTEDFHKGVSYFNWIPHIVSMKDGGKQCASYKKDGYCNSIEEEKPEDDEPEEQVGTDVFQYDFGPGNVKKGFSSIIQSNVFLHRDSIGFGIKDTSKIIEFASTCGSLETGEVCKKPMQEDYIAVRSGAEFIKRGISPGKYTVVIFTGDLDTSKLQSPFTINIEGKKMHRLNLKKGEVKMLTFNVDVEDDDLSIKIERGLHNRINGIIIRRAKYLFDLGNEELKKDYNQVVENTLYDDIKGYGFKVEGDKVDSLLTKLTNGNIPNFSYMPTDSLTSDFLTIKKQLEFAVDIPKGPYYVKILSKNKLNLKVEGKKFKNEKDTSWVRNSFYPYLSKVKVGKDEQMNFIFEAEENSNSQIAAVVICGYDSKGLIVPWWKYLIPAGWPYEHIRRERSERKLISRLLPYVSTAAFATSAGLAYYHFDQSNDSYDIHKTSSIIEERNNAYDDTVGHRKNARLFTYIALGIWLANDAFGLYKDIKLKNKSLNDGTKGDVPDCGELEEIPNHEPVTISIEPSISNDLNGQISAGLLLKLKF